MQPGAIPAPTGRPPAVAAAAAAATADAVREAAEASGAGKSGSTGVCSSDGIHVGGLLAPTVEVRLCRIRTERRIIFVRQPPRLALM